MIFHTNQIWRSFQSIDYPPTTTFGRLLPCREGRSRPGAVIQVVLAVEVVGFTGVAGITLVEPGDDRHGAAVAGRHGVALAVSGDNGFYR